MVIPCMLPGATSQPPAGLDAGQDLIGQGRALRNNSPGHQATPPIGTGCGRGLGMSCGNRLASIAVW